MSKPEVSLMCMYVTTVAYICVRHFGFKNDTQYITCVIPRRGQCCLATRQTRKFKQKKMFRGVMDSSVFSKTLLLKQVFKIKVFKLEQYNFYADLVQMSPDV